MPEEWVISYAPRVDATPEAEIATLAYIYKFVLDAANKNAAGVTSTNGDEAMKGSNDDRASGIISDR